MPITLSFMPVLRGAAPMVAGAVLAAAAAAGARGSDPLSPAPLPTRCDGAIQHPLRIETRVVDPLVRGGIVRVRVSARSRHALERGEVRLVSAGGASLLGPARIPFARLAPGAEAAADFTVRLPLEGRRFLLQFRVEGDSRTGFEARGATLNLLPDGPADPGRLVTSDAGAAIVEYRARRIKP